ncbi:glycosyltransferase [Butyrivibrio fibrisolvens]|uniref:glycosyltransferase n=1 Tax=Butyrivibrio fibrisolvens TaxID=831 RepID=UPI0003B50AA0|nr:glycosyltransferase [Butyrivibrio fibrisolvens]
MQVRYNELTDFEELNVRNESYAKITVLFTTFNHKKYISKALESIVNQKTDIPFEILIYDDASTDGTSDIVREYAMKYPLIIRAFIAKQNTYNHPDKRIVRQAWRDQFASGNYFALCEGDDYWLDDEKLQRQWEALENNTECDMCACWGCTITEDGETEVSQIRPRTEDGILSPEEVIVGGGQYLVTAGLFFRREIFEKKMSFQKEHGMDYMMQIRGALRGGIYYIDRKMAVYRRNAKGSWSERVLYNSEQLEKQWEIETKMLKALDEDTNGKYHNAITERLKSYCTFLSQLYDRRDKIIDIFSNTELKYYLWGMGRRGIDFERFCAKEKITLAGICDISNDQVGSLSKYNNMVCSTEEALREADVILASNNFAYSDLVKSSYKGKIIDLQQFMPYG